MRPNPFPCDIETVKQRYQCWTEKVIAQKIGGQVHQDGGIGILEPDSKKEMYRIVGGKNSMATPIIRRERR